MGTPRTAPISTDAGNRLKGAAFGFVLTVAPLVGFACVQLLLAPSIVENAGFDLETDGWVVSDYRTGLVWGYAWIVAGVFSYWMLAWACGRGRILTAKWANLTLAASVLTFGLAMVIASVASQPAKFFHWACPSLGLSDTYPRFGFDVPTPCEAFASKAAPTVLLGLPLLLLIASALLRVIGSRRSWRRSVR